MSLGMCLVAEGVLSIAALIDRMALAPARILGLERGVRPGLAADLTLIDPDVEYTLRAETLKSKSRNTPFDGWTFKGRAALTMVGGKIVHRA